MKVANLELVLDAKDLAGHGQDPARGRGGHTVDDNWSHVDERFAVVAVWRIRTATKKIKNYLPFS